MNPKQFNAVVEYFEEYSNFDIPQEEKDKIEKTLERLS